MKIGFIFLIVIFIGSYYVGLMFKNDKRLQSTVNSSACDLLKGSCKVVGEDIEYEISFIDPPSPLTPFNIHFSALNGQPSKVEIKFTMEGMDMGNNVYSLENKGKYWGAKVLLPVCSLSRNDWLLRVNAIYGENVHSTDFKFSQ